MPLSLRIARLLLVLAGGLVVGTFLFIAAASSNALGAAPWLALLLLDAAAFFRAWWLLPRDPSRAKPLAVAAAIGMAGLGVVTGFGAGMLSFPAASTGVVAAWAALLHPPTRRIALAFAAYLAIGVAVSVLTAGPALFSIFTILFVFLWPGRLVLFPAGSLVSIYVLLGLAAALGISALVRPGGASRPMSARMWVVALVAGVLGGAAIVGAFYALQNARPSTSARFELLDPAVLAIVFAGGLCACAGAVALASTRRPLAALALGLGAAALLMTFGASPAVTCQEHGVGQSVPLAWWLRAPFEGGSSSFSSGGSGTGGGPGGRPAPNDSSGELRFGTHHATFRCAGDQLVEFREVP